MELSDIELVTLVKAAQDNAAFELLVRRHQAALRAFLRRLSGDAASADDMAQEALMKAHARIETFEGGSSFRSWLFAIAHREFLQARRKDGAGARLAEALKADADPEAAALDSASTELSLDLLQALAALDDGERAAILMCDAVGFTHAEAAAALETPLGTLKTHVARAREKMRASLRAPAETSRGAPDMPPVNGACHAV
ncbi:MAG: RNA polymerase sigma factor [Parvularculaceae bacterium]